MGWRSLIESGWKPPYVACIRRGDRPVGSGLLVGPRHVLTALHVLVDFSNDPSGEAAADNRSRTVGEPLPAPSTSEAVEISFASNAARTMTGRCRQFDRNADLALLELDGALHGVALPRFADVSVRGSQTVVALGFVAEGEARRPVFRRQTGHVKLDTGVHDAAIDEHYQVLYGAQGGFSGGPVFLADDGVCPRLIGMSRLGGDGFDQGKIVAADLIAAWLKPRLAGFSPRPETRDTRSEILMRGFEPCHRLDEGADLSFVAIAGNDRDGAPPTFVALAPVSRARAETATATASSGPFDDERPAHFGSAAAVTDVFEHLGRRHGLRFRAPTIAEIAGLAALGRGRSSRGLLGEPMWLRHFVEDDGSPRLPPDGVLEWCSARSSPIVREHRGDGLRETTATPRPRTRMVARLAFDVEVGA